VFSETSKPPLRPTHPHTQLVAGFFPRGKAVGGLKLTIHPPYRHEVKNKWSYTSIPLQSDKAWIGTTLASFIAFEWRV
jgi:hypothetical protein